MATSIVPALIDALVAQSTAGLSGITAYDGYGISDDPGDYLMIGVDDPDSPLAAASAESEQEWANIGHVVRDESGSVTCLALSWNGNSDAKAARVAAYATTAAFEDLLRADPTLGLGPTVRVQFGSQNLTQQQDDGGASAVLIFKIHFDARI